MSTQSPPALRRPDREPGATGTRQRTRTVAHSSGIYLGQALGAGVGGLLLDHHLEPGLIPLASTALGVFALAAHLLTMRKIASPGEKGVLQT